MRSERLALGLGKWVFGLLLLLAICFAGSRGMNRAFRKLVVTQTGITGEYYKGAAPQSSVIEAQVSNMPAPTYGATGWNAYYTAYLTPTVSGTYTIKALAGVTSNITVTIDGSSAFGQVYMFGSMVTTWTPRSLVAGVQYKLVASYTMTDAASHPTLTWALSGGTQQVIASSFLTPAVDPQIPVASAVPGPNSITISWPAIATASSYEVFRSITAGGEVYTTKLNQTAITGTTGTVSYTDQPLDTRLYYYYTVKAKYPNPVWSGHFTYSSPSNEVNGTRTGALVPTDITPNPPLGILPDAFTLPEWRENVVPSDTSASPEGGPSSAIGVSLPHGVVDVDSGPDLVVSNPRGPSISFERQYRTALAAGNLSSPGLPRGWSHNWDYRIVPLQTGSWGSLKLVYPNGASETISPILDGSGYPTGDFTVPVGAPYVASGLPGSNFIWRSITLRQNGSASQLFGIPNGETILRLQMQVFENGTCVFLNYQGKKLTGITNDGAGATAMSLQLAYGSSTGLLSSVSDVATGNFRTYGYTSGELTSVSTIGNTATEWLFSYLTISDAPYLNNVSTADPHGNASTATISYNQYTGRPTGFTDAKGGARSYDYSDKGSASVTISNASSRDTYTAAWDSSKRETSFVSASGDATTYEYGSPNPGAITAIKPPVGQPTTVQTDSHGHPTYVTYPYGNGITINWEYPAIAPLGRVASVQEVGKDGSTKQPTIYTYYDLGDLNGFPGYLKTTQSPCGGITTYTYTTAGNVATVSDETSRISYSYTDDGAVERFGMPTSVTDNIVTNGVLNRWTFQYDTGGRLIQTTDPLSRVVATQYNQYNQPVTTSLPLSNSASFAYGVNGKAPLSVILNNQTVRNNTYDKESGLSSAMDANGNSDTFGLDAEFGLAQVKNGNQQLMHTFACDQANRTMRWSIGSGSRGTAYTTLFDGLGEVTSTIGSDGRTLQTVYTAPGMPFYETRSDYWFWYYDYDSFGRLKSEINASLPTTTVWGGVGAQPPGYHWVYDDENRPLTYYDGSGHGTTYTYNLDGTLCTMTVTATTRTVSVCTVCYQYSYDADKRVTDIEAKGPNGVVLTYAKYTYDAVGRVVAVHSKNATVLYTYDDLDRVIKLQNLTADGHPSPNAPVEATILDPSDGSAHTILSSFENINYDRLGNRTSMDIFAQTAFGPNLASTYAMGAASWAYDNGGRLIGENWTGFGSPVALSYSYDNADNVVSLRGLTFAVDSLSDQLTGGAGAGLYQNVRFNSSGEMTQWGSMSAQYNEAGDITKIYTDNGNSLQDEYACGPDGVRARKISYNSTERVDDPQVFLYLNGSLVHRESYWTDMQGNGVNGEVFYLWGPTGPVEEFSPVFPDLKPNTSRALLYDPSGNCLSTVSAKFVEPNTDQSFYEPAFYDAYGKRVWPAASETQRAWAQPLQYKGKFGCYTDAGTGLIYCIHRYYDPGSGRWISRDPVGLNGGVNVYLYCNGNPVTKADPDGTRPITETDLTLLHWLYASRGDVPLKDINAAVRRLKKDIAAVPTGSSDPPGMKALWWAISKLGDPAYGQEIDGVWKCNIFAYDAYLEGADVPMPDRKPYQLGTQPYSANTLGDPGITLRYFDLVSKPGPGDIIAFYSPIEGHTTLSVDGYVLIYASKKDVKVGTYPANLVGHTKHAIRRHQ